MSEEKTDAIVIRTIEFSETRSIVTFFTRDHGKVSTLAKGARRKKGPFESALDLLATCRIVFLHKTGDTLDLLTEAKLQNRLRATQNSLDRLYACYYIAELLRKFTDEMDPHPRLYEATQDSLRAIEDESQAYEPILLRFELTLLRETGHTPSLADCAGCGRRIYPQSRVAFGMLAGGVLCAHCQIGQRAVVSIRAEVLEILTQFADPDSDQWRTQPEYSRCEREIRPIINRYFIELMGGKPRMHGFIPVLGKSIRSK